MRILYTFGIQLSIENMKSQQFRRIEKKGSKEGKEM